MSFIAQIKNMFARFLVVAYWENGNVADLMTSIILDSQHYEHGKPIPRKVLERTYDARAMDRPKRATYNEVRVTRLTFMPSSSILIMLNSLRIAYQTERNDL